MFCSGEADVMAPEDPQQETPVGKHGQRYVLNDQFCIRVNQLTNSMFCSGEDNTMRTEDP